MSQTAERRLLGKARSYKPLIGALLKDYKQSSDPQKIQNKKKLREIYNILLLPSEELSYETLTHLMVILEEIPKTELPAHIVKEFKYLMPVADVIELSDSEETDDPPTVSQPLKQEKVMAGQLPEGVAVEPVETGSDGKDVAQMTASIDETCSVALPDVVEMKQNQDAISTAQKSTDSIDSMTDSMISPWQTDSLSSELGINILQREIATLNDIGGKCIYCSFNGSVNTLVKHCVQMHPCQEVFVSRFLMTKGHEIVLHPLFVTGKLCGRKILFKCLCCERSHLFTRDEWIEHMENHTGEFSYRCQECLVVGRISTLKHNDACTTRRSIRVTSFGFDGNHLYAYACMLCYYVQLSVKRVQQHLTAKHLRPENITGKLWQIISVVNFEPESVAPVPESKKPIVNTDGADSSDTEPTEKIIVTYPGENRKPVATNYDSDSSDTVEKSNGSVKPKDKYACFERHDSSTATDGQKTDDSVKVDNKISFAKLKRSSVSISIDSVRLKQDSSIPTEQQETDSDNDMEETLNSVPLEPDSSTAMKRQNMELRRTVPKRQKTAAQRNVSDNMERNSLPHDPDDPDDSVNEVGSSNVSSNLRSTVSSSNTATNRRKTTPQTNVNVKQSPSFAREPRKSLRRSVYLTRSSQRRITLQTNKAVRVGATTSPKRLQGISKKLVTGKKKSPEANTSSNKETVQELNTTVVKPWVKNATSKTKRAAEIMLTDVSLLKFYKCMETSCSYASNDEKELVTHLSHHQEEYNSRDSSSTGKPSWLECSYCDLVADSIEDLVKHLGPSHDDSAFQCPSCFYRSRVTFNVFVHQKQFHPGTDSYTAFICKKFVKRVTESEKLVLKELLTERADEVRCQECEKSFFSIRKFQKHVESHELKDISCQYCTETVPTKDIVAHFLTHNKGFVECLYCGSAFNTVKHMKIHICINHSNALQYCACRSDSDSLQLLQMKDYVPIMRNIK